MTLHITQDTTNKQTFSITHIVFFPTSLVLNKGKRIHVCTFFQSDSHLYEIQCLNVILFMLTFVYPLMSASVFTLTERLTSISRPDVGLLSGGFCVYKYIFLENQLSTTIMSNVENTVLNVESQRAHVMIW